VSRQDSYSCLSFSSFYFATPITAVISRASIETQRSEPQFSVLRHSFPFKIGAHSHQMRTMLQVIHSPFSAEQLNSHITPLPVYRLQSSEKRTMKTIVTTRLIKAKDGERRIKKALKIQEMRQPVLKKMRGKKLGRTKEHP